MNDSCNCFVARHLQAAEIEIALRDGEDPRAVAARYGIGKSRVYDHRRHLLGGPTPAQGGSKGAPAGAETPTAPSVPSASAPEPVATPVPPPVERSMELVERVERRVESGGMVSSSPAGPARALPVRSEEARAVPGGGYLQAVDACLELITERRWRPTRIRGIAEQFGLSVDRARHAYHEATRHLQLDMGGYVQKQATSAAWTMGQRDEAKARAESAAENAERWRKQEREAQEEADKLEGKERISALETAARFGLLATKYDLSAEKWSAQALAHQRHLDEVLCLRSPKEINATQINLGGDGSAKLEEFARALAARFRDQPEILAAIDAAAEAVERGQEPGDAAAILTTAEAA